MLTQQRDKQEASFHPFIFFYLSSVYGTPNYGESKQEAWLQLCAISVSALWPMFLKTGFMACGRSTYFFVSVRAGSHEANYSDTAKCCHMTCFIE